MRGFRGHALDASGWFVLARGTVTAVMTAAASAQPCVPVVSLHSGNDPCSLFPEAVYAAARGAPSVHAWHWSGSAQKPSAIASVDLGGQVTDIGTISQQYGAPGDTFFGQMAVFGGENDEALFVTGYFDLIDGLPCTGFAAWNGSGWRAAANVTGKSGSAAFPYLARTVDYGRGERLVLGGGFSYVDGVAAVCLASGMGLHGRR